MNCGLASQVPISADSMLKFQSSPSQKNQESVFESSPDSEQEEYPCQIWKKIHSLQIKILETGFRLKLFPGLDI